MSDERVCIFVDGENLFDSEKRQGIEVDYLKLKELDSGDSRSQSTCIPLSARLVIFSPNPDR